MDVYIALLILGMQLTNCLYWIMLHSKFPSEPNGLHDPEIIDTFINLRSVSYRWQLIILIDTVTTCLCVLSLMTALRKLKTIDLVLN